MFFPGFILHASWLIIVVCVVHRAKSVVYHKGLCSAWLNHVLHSLDQNGPESMQCYCCLSKPDHWVGCSWACPTSEGCSFGGVAPGWPSGPAHMIIIQKFTLIVPIQFYFKNVLIPFDWFWPKSTDWLGRIRELLKYKIVSWLNFKLLLPNSLVMTVGPYLWTIWSGWMTNRTKICF